MLKRTDDVFDTRVHLEIETLTSLQKLKLVAVSALLSLMVVGVVFYFVAALAWNAVR